MGLWQWIYYELKWRAIFAIGMIVRFLRWFDRTIVMIHYRYSLAIWPTTVKIGVGALALEGFVFTFHHLLHRLLKNTGTPFTDAHTEIAMGIIFMLIVAYALWRPKMGGLLAALTFYIFVLILSVTPIFNIIGFVIWTWLAILATKDTVRFSMLLLHLHQRDEEAEDDSQ